MLNKTVLEKFLVLEQTGENDLFLTYNGKDTQTGLAVNVTAIKPNMVAPVDFLERLESLAKAITKIESPHTVPVLEYGEVEGQVVIVREGIEGQSLADLVTGGNGLQLDIVFDIARQLGEYVEAIHQAGVFQVVFDPEEILLSSDSVVRVTDLGMAQGWNIGELLAEGKAKALPYHAPELLRGEKTDSRTDFYSLGALLFQILTGKEWDAKAVASDQSLIADMLPSRLRLGIPPEWDELVAKCLHPVPAKRIQSAAEFMNRVTEVQRGMAEGAQATMIGMEDSLVGQTLGAYRLVERLGQGGMATVYKGYEAALDRYVAVKVLPQFFASDPNFTHRFRREAKAIAQLNHPNIIPIYSYGEESGITYLVMQNVEGGTLKHERGQISTPEEALRLLLPIARALGYAHERGIVHRDIKPSNVLMAEGNWPMLADFGLAQMAESSMKLTGSGVGMGTPMYMSPEQGRGDQVDARTDIYSLGIMLYELVTGDVPFRADTPMAIVIKHMTAPMPMPRQLNPNIPIEVENIILKSTAKDVDDRYQTAGEMVTAMERVLNRLAAAIKDEEIVEDVRSKKIKAEHLSPVLNPEAKKIKKIVLIAILGLLGLCLIGVVMMGVFDICPPIGPWPQPPWCAGSPYKLPTFGEVTTTTVPTPMITEGTLGQILFQDDFDGQISSRWAFTSSPYLVPWEAIEMDGRTVMHSLPPNPPGDSSTAEIKPTTWENYAVQFDFRFLEPDQFGAFYFELIGRLTDCPPTIQSTQSYATIISSELGRLTKNYCRQGGSIQISENDRNIDPEAWHTLQYEFISNHIQVLIDGEKYIDYTDKDEPITSGGNLWITTFGESEILIDNLKVYEVVTGSTDVVPSTMEAETPANGTVMQEYSDDFENGLGDFWSTGGWYTENLTGNQVARGFGALNFVEQLVFNDYELELDFYPIDPTSSGNYGAYLILRRGDCPPSGGGALPSQIYYLEILNSGMNLKKWLCDGSSEILVNLPGEVAPGQWHHLRARLVGAHIEVSIDNQKMIDYVDENDPILEGEFLFGGAGDEGITYFDNFSMKTISSDSTGSLKEGEILDWCEPNICINTFSGSQKIIKIDPNYRIYFIPELSWSPDGSKIVFTACHIDDIRGDGTCLPDLYITDREGNISTLLRNPGEYDEFADWSPDGEWIAFETNGGIKIIRPDRSEIRKVIANSPQGLRCPMFIVWSPDSQRLAWVGGDCSTAEIVWVINIDGSGMDSVYYEPNGPQISSGRSLAWSPDGKSVAVATELGDTYLIDVNCNEKPNGCGESSRTLIGGFPIHWLPTFFPRWSGEFE